MLAIFLQRITLIGLYCYFRDTNLVEESMIHSTKEDNWRQHFVIVVKVSIFLVKVVIFSMKNVMIIGMVNFIQPYCYR